MSNWSREYRVDDGGRRQIVITENKPAKPYEPLYMKFFKVMTSGKEGIKAYYGFETVELTEEEKAERAAKNKKAKDTKKVYGEFLGGDLLILVISLLFVLRFLMTTVYSKEQKTKRTALQSFFVYKTKSIINCPKQKYHSLNYKSSCRPIKNINH